MSASLQDPDLQAHWDYFIGQTREKRAVRGHRSLTGDHPPRAFQIEGGNQYPHYPHYPQVLSWSHFSLAGIAGIGSTIPASGNTVPEAVCGVCGYCGYCLPGLF